MWFPTSDKKLIVNFLEYTKGHKTQILISFITIYKRPVNRKQEDSLAILR